jgi:hypothetical protein
MTNIHLYAGLIIIVGVVLALGVLARNLQPRGFAEKWDKGEAAAFFPGMHLRPLIGATVIAFRADGCMAHDHVFLWAGVIDRLEPSPMGNVPPGRYVDAVVRVCKRAGNPYDATDRDLGEERALVEHANPGLYKVAPNLYTYTV